VPGDLSLSDNDTAPATLAARGGRRLFSEGMTTLYRHVYPIFVPIGRAAVVGPNVASDPASSPGPREGGRFARSWTVARPGSRVARRADGSSIAGQCEDLVRCHPAGSRPPHPAHQRYSAIVDIGHLQQHRDAALDPELYLRVRQKAEALADVTRYGHLTLRGDAHAVSGGDKITLHGDRATQDAPSDARGEECTHK
jgi:hypothetical protein